MATLTIYVPDVDMARVTEAIVNNYGFTGSDTEAFVNSVLCGFIRQNVAVYEENKIKQNAIDAAGGQVGNIIVDNGITATPHKYYMVISASAKQQYDYLANQIIPGISFDIPLSSSGQGDASAFAIEVAVTEEIRIKLSAIELINQVDGSADNVKYVRCDNMTNKILATNINNIIVGNVCTLADVLSALELQEIPA